MSNARVIGLLVLATMAIVACETTASRQAADDRNINKDAAAELRSICSLPEAQRKLEIERLRQEHNVTIFCPPEARDTTP